MPAIEKLKIKGFKAFPNEFELKLDGKHLLLYGENGSGKSSIYYALHSFFLASKKSHKGRVFLDPLNSKNYLNRYIAEEAHKNARIVATTKNEDDTFQDFELNYEGLNPVSGRIYEPQNIFINHNFLSTFYSNKLYGEINLFRILSFEVFYSTLNQSGRKFISEIFDEIYYSLIQKKNSMLNKSILDKIEDYNQSVLKIVNNINVFASDRYNNFFKNDGDNELKIKLYYPQENDDPDKYYNGYWLKYDRLQQLETEKNETKLIVSKNKSTHLPFIRLEISEKLGDTWRVINNPDLFFNEAKLTAIALSIRFSLLDLESDANGRFLALDDMLISLDMSNRTKVIDFLLSIADKYKIYLFTHDLNFYDLVKKKIEKEQNKKHEWVIGKLFMNDFSKIPFPEFFPEKNKITHAKQFLTCHDYPACGIYLRRECESIFDNLFPDSLKKDIKKDENGNDRSFDLNLNDKILNLEKFCKEENIGFDRFKSIKTYKDVVLNALAHNDSTSPIFKAELKALIISLEELQKIKRGEVILKNSKDPSINFIAKGKNIAICLRTREHIVLIEENGVKRLSNYGRCEVTKIIEDGVDKAESETFDSLNDAYMHYCKKYEKAPDDNLIDVIMYRGNPLKDKL